MICQSILADMQSTIEAEHTFYRLGEAAFNSKLFMEDESFTVKLSAFFGEKWKQIRYRNLVRLGADIENSGLAEYSKATILGGLLYYTKQQASSK